MSEVTIGGQAVIEGVMMRSKTKIATAVRTQDGQIVVKAEDYVSLSARYPLLNLPLIRGAVTFVEMTVIGIRTLNFSADIALNESRKSEQTATPKHTMRDSVTLALTVTFSLLFGIVLFIFTPLAVANLFGISNDALQFNLLAGGVRLTMFVLYVWSLSFVKDFKRLFQYHGAEHKAIYTYELGLPLTVERAREQTRFHPRCGTSFVLIVALVAILTYAIVDTLYAVVFGESPDLIRRFLVHVLLLPLVAGTAYELLKLSGKTRENVITKMLIQPGMWLQRITTNEPDDSHLEVAIVALESALHVEVNQIAPSTQTPA